ncbi:hypothetical protein HDU80_011703 [Chytriomyces hyalinus]|nr:hypothetical protein HDU80_011703 [Chytriomyces hyalinus]
MPQKKTVKPPHTDKHEQLMRTYATEECGFYVARVTQPELMIPNFKPREGDFVKFGITRTSLGSRVKSHTSDFGTFNLILFIPTEKCAHLEKEFKKHPLCEHREKGYQTRHNNHTEILRLSENCTVKMIQEEVVKLTRSVEKKFPKQDTRTVEELLSRISLGDAVQNTDQVGRGFEAPTLKSGKQDEPAAEQKVPAKELPEQNGRAPDQKAPFSLVGERDA